MHSLGFEPMTFNCCSWDQIFEDAIDEILEDSVYTTNFLESNLQNVPLSFDGDRSCKNVQQCQPSCEIATVLCLSKRFLSQEANLILQFLPIHIAHK